MDSASSFEPETSPRNLANKCLNINKDTKKEASLSNLTAKYSSSKKNMSVFSCMANSTNSTLNDHGHRNVRNQALGDGFSNSTFEKSKYLSSSEDESDTGLSLVALAAKHKSPLVSNSSSLSRSSEQDMVVNSSEDEYSDTGSLAALAAKYKGIRKTNSKSNVSLCLTEARKDMIKMPDVDRLKIEIPVHKKVSEKSQTVNCRGKDLSRKISEESEKSTLELNPRYISPCFSDDSDSDDSFTLCGLALRHARAASQSESGSADDKSHFKPKELQRVTNFHRSYSKSESDQFAVSQMDTGIIVNEDFRNESSTSLGSLKGSDSSKQGFEFLLGCNIPNSFKSKHLGLTSSLVSVQVPQANLNTSFTDPDVSITEKKRCKSPFQYNLRDDCRDKGNIGGINLASAIKSSSSTNVIKDDDNDLQAEPMDEEIVTLLDTLTVDEGVDTNKSSKSSSIVIRGQKDDCCLDARHILKVKSKLQTTKCSSFGKVVCKQWRSLKTPYIRKEELMSQVVPFKFSSPSPDDVMAGFRERRYQNSKQE